VERTAPADRGEDQAEHVTRPVERRHLVAIAHDGREMIALLQSHAGERAGGGADLGVPPRKGALTLAIDDRNRVRLAFDRCSEGGTQIHHSPPVRFYIWSRFLRRTGDYFAGKRSKSRGRVQDRSHDASIARAKTYVAGQTV